MKELVYNYLLHQIPEALAVEAGLIIVVSVVAVIRRKFIYKLVESFIKKERETFAYKVDFVYFTENKSYDINYEYD